MRILTPSAPGAIIPAGTINNYSTGGMPLVASIQTNITISADIVTLDAPLWTSSGGTLLVVSALTLVTATTAGTFTAYTSYTNNGATTNPNVGILNIATPTPNNANLDYYIYSDAGSTFGWSYEVAGFAGANAEVRLSIKAYLAA